MAIKNKIYFLCFFFLFLSFVTLAQETQTKLPLAEVFVKLQKQYNIQFNFAEDKIEGITIVPPSQDLPLDEVLTYLEVNTDFSFENLDGTFILVKTIDQPFEVQQLSEIVLSKYIVKGINKISNGSLEIDFNQFDILPGLIDTDVLQAVQALPGIQSINETVSNINIRAGTNDQNLILWDGIKMYQSGHFFGLISMFNPQITQRVNVVKNGTQVSLTDGVSGTIAMKTNSQLNKKFKGNVGLNFIDANAFVDVPLGQKSSLQFAVRKSISDFAETPTYTNFFKRISQDTEVDMNSNNAINSDQDFDFYDTSLRWIYNVSEKDQIKLNFFNASNELSFNENTQVNNIQTSRESSLSQNSIAGGLQYKRLWSEKWQTELDVYETDYKLKADNSNIIDSQRFIQENKISETSIKLKTNNRLNNQFELLSGYHFVETKITNLDDVDNPRFKSLVSEVVRTHAIFSQANHRFNNYKTNISLGLRYNYIEKFKRHLLEPRLTFNHKFFNHFSLEILGEFKHQNTSQVINFQNDFLGIEKRRWQLSNDDDIPIIRSKQVSVGLTYSKKGWLISMDSYYKYVNGITTQSQGFLNQYEFAKTHGNYDVYGLDVLLRKEINSFNSWLSYSFLRSDYEFNSLPEQNFPSNFDVNHSITLGSTYTWSKLKLSAGLNWHSGRPTTQPVSGSEFANGSINYEPTNSSELKDYFRIDVSALYDFNIGKTTKANLGVSVWNVLDRSNEINNFYRVNNGSLSETLQSSLGITSNVLLRVHF